MLKANKSTIHVQGTAITVLGQREDSFISLTDIARTRNADRSDDLVRNWLRNRNTVEFLGIWERLNNADFNSVEFDGIKMQAGLNSFTLTPKQCIGKVNAIGIVSQAAQRNRHPPDAGVDLGCGAQAAQGGLTMQLNMTSPIIRQLSARDAP